MSKWLINRPVTLLLGITVVVIGCEREPTSYEDCILKNVKAGMSEKAVQIVTAACAAKYVPASEQKEGNKAEALTPLEIMASLDGRGGLSFGNHFAGTIYNGFDDRTLTEIEITVTTSMGGTKVSKVYHDEVSIAPRSAGDFGFDIIVGDKGTSYDWTITGAKAVK